MKGTSLAFDSCEMFSSLPKDPLEGENSREKFPVELECFWFRLYGTGSPPSSSSNTAGPPSEFQLFGQGISQNSCCSRLGFNSVAQNFSTFPSPFSGNILCSEKPKKKLLLTLCGSGRRNPSRDAAHTTFSSSSCSLFCDTSKSGSECC